MIWKNKILEDKSQEICATNLTVNVKKRAYKPKPFDRIVRVQKRKSKCRENYSLKSKNSE